MLQSHKKADVSLSIQAFKNKYTCFSASMTRAKLQAANLSSSTFLMNIS